MKRNDDKDIKQYRSLLKYTALFGSVSVINMFSSFIRNKFTALFLGASGVGILSLYNSLITFLSQLTNLGISSGGVAFLADEDEAKAKARVSTIRTWSILVAIIGFILPILFAGPLILFTFGNSVDVPYLNMTLVGLTIASLSLTSGEQVILKSFRHLSQLSRISVVSTLLSVAIVIPLYYFFRSSAILWVILLMSLTSLLLTLRVSLRLYPYSITTFREQRVVDGIPLLRIGGAMLAAGIMSSGIEYLIRTLILDYTDSRSLGLYNAAMMISIVYMGMILSSIDQDYYSRLSLSNSNEGERTKLVNQQVHLAMLIMTPLLAILIVALPILLPLLYSDEFVRAVGLVRLTMVYMFIRPIILPISYLALVIGDIRRYLLLDFVVNLIYLSLALVGLQHFGTYGVAAALSLSSIIEVVIIGVNAYYRYNLRVNSLTRIDIAVLWFMLSLSIGSYFVFYGLTLVIVQSLICIPISIYSIYRLNQATGFISYRYTKKGKNDRAEMI